MHILYVSQLAPAGSPRREAALLEAATAPGILAELGAATSFHDATAAPPPDPVRFDGVIVGGSFGSANDEEPWRVALREWLGEHVEVPLLGLCGGHQLLARALGGTVEVAPGPQLGVYPLALPGIPGFTGRVVQLHSERVGAPPASAEVWATDDMGIQALRYGARRWTFQFHPEMHPALVRTAGGYSGLGEETWRELDAAVADGRAILKAWLAAVNAGV